MATKKSGKGGGRAKAGVKATARGRKAKPTAKKKTAARSARTAKTGKSPAAAKRPAKPTRPAPKSVRGGAESAELTALKSRFQRERNALEKRLTETVREIGVLRHHELRADQLETQLHDREGTIARLQQQIAELERRPAEPVYEREVQQSFALAVPVQDLDEIEDDPLAEEDV